MSTHTPTRAARAAQAAATPPRYTIEIDGKVSGEYTGPYSRYFPLQLWFRLQILYLFDVPAELETVFPAPDSKALDYLSEVLTELARPGFIETYTDAELGGAGWLLHPPDFSELTEAVAAGWRIVAAAAGPEYAAKLATKEERATKIARLKSSYYAQKLPGNIERARAWVAEQRATLPRLAALPQPLEPFDTPAAAAAVAWGETHSIRYDGERFEVSGGGQSFRLRPHHFVSWLAAGIVAAAEARPDAYNRGAVLADGLADLTHQRPRLAGHPDALAYLDTQAAALATELEKYRRVTTLGPPPTAAPAAPARRAPAARPVGWGGLLRHPLSAAGLYDVLAGLGLLTEAGGLTELGRNAAPGVWSGIIEALREKQYCTLNYAAARKCLAAELGVILGERTLGTTLSAEGENYKRTTLAELRRVLG